MSYLFLNYPCSTLYSDLNIIQNIVTTTPGNNIDLTQIYTSLPISTDKESLYNFGYNLDWTSITVQNINPITGGTIYIKCSV